MSCKQSFLLAVLFLTACSEPAKTNGKAASGTKGIPKMTGFVLKHYEGPQLAYILRASQADIYEQENISKLTAPELVIFEEGKKDLPRAQRVEVSSGPIKIEAVGERGEINLSTKDVILEGNVVYQVKSTGYILKTQKLLYWSARRETEVPVGTGYTLQTPTGIIEGSGMISKEDLK